MAACESRHDFGSEGHSWQPVSHVTILGQSFWSKLSAAGATRGVRIFRLPNWPGPSDDKNSDDFDDKDLKCARMPSLGLSTLTP